MAYIQNILWFFQRSCSKKLRIIVYLYPAKGRFWPVVGEALWVRVTPTGYAHVGNQKNKLAEFGHRRPACMLPFQMLCPLASGQGVTASSDVQRLCLLLGHEQLKIAVDCAKKALIDEHFCSTRRSLEQQTSLACALLPHAISPFFSCGGQGASMKTEFQTQTCFCNRRKLCPRHRHGPYVIRHRQVSDSLSLPPSLPLSLSLSRYLVQGSK